MQLLSINTVDIKAIQDGGENFDLAIFASGYEPRCIALPMKLARQRFGKVAVFSFKEEKEFPSRKEVGRFYDGLENTVTFEIGGADDLAVYQALRELCADLPKNRTAKVLVDFSSMSRVWYGGILNFFRHTSLCARVELSMCYLAGVYDGAVRSNQVEIINAVPGFEGIAAGSGKSCAIFALGFDPWCAYAIIERIEPDESWALLAERPDLPSYLERARELNSDFIHNYVRDKVIVFPTFDIDGVFGRLCESVSRELTHSADITMIGLGPKPHILAMMLTAIRFPEVSILQARGRRSAPKDIPAQGEGVCARVQFISDQTSNAS